MFNESEYHLLLMNANPTHKLDLISTGIIFYFISAFLTFIQT